MNLRFELLWQQWPWLVVAVFLLVISFWHWRNPPSITAGKRKFLTIFRGASVLLLFIFLLSPVLIFQWNSLKKPEVAVLVDCSSSMSIGENRKPRFAGLLESIRKGGWIRSLQEKGIRLRWFGFSGTFSEIRPSDISEGFFGGSPTDPGPVLQWVRQKSETESADSNALAGVILFTDGRFNSGPDPTELAAPMSIPVHCVGMGDTVEPPRAWIERAQSPVLGKTGDVLKFRFFIGVAGKWEKSLRLELSENQRILGTRKMDGPFLPGLYEFDLGILSRTSGEKRWTARLIQNDAENGLVDQRNVWIHIAKGKKKVACIFGRPSPDARFILRALSRDTTLYTEKFILLLESDLQKAGSFVDKILADSADAILFFDFPMGRLGSNTLSGLANHIQRGMGAAFWGTSVAADKNSGISWFPVVGPLPVLKPSFSAKLKPTPWANSMKIMTQNGADSFPWENLVPPAFYVLALPANMVPILLVAEAEREYPLFFWKRSGKGKMLFYAGKGIWPMDFGTLPVSGQRIGDLFPGWFQWLGTPESAELLSVVQDKKEYNQGDWLRLSAQVFDKAFRPLNDAQLSVEFFREGQAVAHYAMVNDSQSPGLFEASIPLPATGRFFWKCSASWAGHRIGEKSGESEVRENPVELRVVAGDHSVLRKIALLTHGKFYDLPGFEARIADDLSLAPREVLREKRVAMADSPFFLAAWIMVLGIEWFFRKKWRVE